MKKLKSENDTTPTASIVKSKKNLEEIAERISSSAAGTLNARKLADVINERLCIAKAAGEAQKIKVAIKAEIEIGANDTVDFSAWSEIATQDKTTSERVGETFDLLQMHFAFGDSEKGAGDER